MGQASQGRPETMNVDIQTVGAEKDGHPRTAVWHPAGVGGSREFIPLR